MEKFDAHGIDVVTLVSHTSHIIQPLDAVIFSVFKENLRHSLETTLLSFLKGLVDAPPEEASTPSDSESDPTDYDDDVVDTSQDEEAPKRKSKLQLGLDRLKSDQKRYCLINTAMNALDASLLPQYIMSSFEATGVFPLSLTRALQRKYV